MLVKHHGCQEMVVTSLNGNYRQMAKQSQENSIMKFFSNSRNYRQMAKQSYKNSRVKMFFDTSTIRIMNYLHGVE